MIRFALKCENGHRFESWFQSGPAYQTLSDRGLVVCPDCGSSSVSKDLMAPKVRIREDVQEQNVQQPIADQQSVANAPDPKLVEAIQKLRTHVEENSEYVGQGFAREARAMHDGDMPHRAIYGEVAPNDAKDLIEDGVPAVPLPFIPRQKTN